MPNIIEIGQVVLEKKSFKEFPIALLCAIGLLWGDFSGKTIQDGRQTVRPRVSKVADLSSGHP